MYSQVTVAVIWCLCDLWRGWHWTCWLRLQQEPCCGCSVSTHTVWLTLSSPVTVVWATWCFRLNSWTQAITALWQKSFVVRARSCSRGPSTPWVMRAGFNRLQVRLRQAGRAFEVEANWDPGPSLTSSQHRHIRFQLTLSLLSPIASLLLSALFFSTHVHYLYVQRRTAWLLQYVTQYPIYRYGLTNSLQLWCQDYFLEGFWPSVCVCVRPASSSSRCVSGPGWASRELWVLRVLTLWSIVSHLSCDDVMKSWISSLSWPHVIRTGHILFLPPLTKTESHPILITDKEILQKKKSCCGSLAPFIWTMHKYVCKHACTHLIKGSEKGK